MLPRRILPIETTYDKHFPGSFATLFTPYDTKRQKPFFALLRKAMKRNTPVTANELIEFYTEKGFESNLELIVEWYDLSSEEILRGL